MNERLNVWFFFSLAVILVPTLFALYLATEQRKFGLKAIFFVSTGLAIVFVLARYLARQLVH
jgi:hypothetical protein